MISGILALIPLLLAANPPTASAPTPDAGTAAIIARLARPAPDDTAYREVRFVSVLEQPLILSGELHYGGSAELGKRVDQPYQETTTISAGQVEVRRRGKPAQHFSLERAPELQALLSAFSALLGGDAATLAKYYRIEASQDGDAFTLTLTPQLADLARHLRQVTVDGKGSTPRCFSFRQTDGDSSVMLVGPLAAAPLPQPPTPASLAALCRSGAP
jgi:hypothetical protein